jgi:predicted HicB family RNase H-like nuclease
MNDKLKYKDFIGSVQFSSDDEIFFGKVEGVNDLVTFEGATVAKLKKAFKDAADDYLELCEEVGKEAFKSFKGSFNVRLNPELHSMAFKKATMQGKTLNQFVKESIEMRIQGGTDKGRPY